MANGETKKIMFSGGGTGGSVTPLLAVAEELMKDGPVDLIFVGSANGPEKDLVASFNDSLAPDTAQMVFVSLKGGKWRRYSSWRNFWDIFVVLAGFFRAFNVLRRFSPDLVVSAGSFLSVPLVWAAALKKIPVLIHQQDIRPGLANKLMAPFARTITVTFEKSLIDYGPKAALVGNPIKDLSGYAAKTAATKQKYSLNLNQPLVLIFGGSTGATAINELVFKEVKNLSASCQIVHLAGKGKLADNRVPNIVNYHPLEFVDNEEALNLMVASDLVVSRAGLGVLTELSALAKPTILIPMPDSHQEDNAALFARQGAAVVLNQKKLTAEELTAAIKNILNDEKLRTRLGGQIAKMIKPGAAEKIAAIIWEMVKTNDKK